MKTITIIVAAFLNSGCDKSDNRQLLFELKNETEKIIIIPQENIEVKTYENLGINLETVKKIHEASIDPDVEIIDKVFTKEEIETIKQKGCNLCENPTNAKNPYY